MVEQGHLLAICGLLILSALFSGSETAFFSITKLQMKKMENEKSFFSSCVYRLLQKPKRLLITILLVNTIVNILAMSLGAIVAMEFANQYYPNAETTASLILFIEIALMTILLLVVGEIVPKLFAFSKAEEFASAVSGLIIIIQYVLFPVIWVLSQISYIFSKKMDIAKNQQITSEDFRNFVTSHANNHPLEENEKRIIDNIMRFNKTDIKEIMVPRVDITGIEITDSLDELKKLIVESGYSRIPVYKKTMDDIIGVVYAKDLLLAPEKKNIGTLLRKPLYVTENMKIQNLLNHFKTKKIQIAIVVDEYGGTSGLISLEDILEQLVGEIMDEYDEEHPMIVKISENDYVISGMYNIADLNREFSLNLDEEHDNLAGFLFDAMNHVPVKNESHVYNDAVEFTITSIKKQRICYVRMRILRENGELIEE